MLLYINRLKQTGTSHIGKTGIFEFSMRHSGCCGHSHCLKAFESQSAGNEVRKVVIEVKGRLAACKNISFKVIRYHKETVHLPLTHSSHCCVIAFQMQRYVNKLRSIEVAGQLARHRRVVQVYYGCRHLQRQARLQHSRKESAHHKGHHNHTEQVHLAAAQRGYASLYRIYQAYICHN